jgi:hypothetical protein
MKKSSKSVRRFPRLYRQLQRQLGQVGYLSQGSVFQRAPDQQGSRYVWTRKVQAKTVTVALLRIPMKADTCSNPYRTPFRSCRTVVGAKRRSEGVINGCPTGVKFLPQFWCSFGAPPRGDDWTFNPRASSRRLFGRAVSGGNGLSNSSSRCRRSLRVTDSLVRPNRRACD